MTVNVVITQPQWNFGGGGVVVISNYPINFRNCTANGNPMPAIVNGKLFVSDWVKRFIKHRRYGL